MNYNKFRDTCRVVRVVAGVVLVSYAAYSSNYWFYLGVAPLIAGLVNFCPTCIVTKKCDIKKK